MIKMIVLNIMIDSNMSLVLKKQAKTHDRSVSSYVRTVLKDYHKDVVIVEEEKIEKNTKKINIKPNIKYFIKDFENPTDEERNNYNKAISKVKELPGLMLDEDI